MPSILRTFYEHNLWANLRLLDVCAGLDPALLRASAPGTYGSVGDTLLHLASAERNYVASITGGPPPGQLDRSQGFQGAEALREPLRLSGQALIEIADQVSPDLVLRGEFRGQPYEMPVVVPMLQAINHATEHRAHVVTILTANGVPVPALDSWSFHEQ